MLIFILRISRFISVWSGVHSPSLFALNGTFRSQGTHLQKNTIAMIMIITSSMNRTKLNMMTLANGIRMMMAILGIGTMTHSNGFRSGTIGEVRWGIQSLNGL